MDDTHLLSIISLIVAAIAVFFGPLISWVIAKRQVLASEQNIFLQTETSLKIANQQIIAPMRQAWIYQLRDLIAELTGLCNNFWIAGFEARQEIEYQRITELKNKLILYINPNEENNNQLIEEIKRMVKFLLQGKDADDDYWEAHNAVIKLSQKILKIEWNRVKNKI